jgi:uncharacterized SAM-binding protein YcdF (DUF218 family)
MKTFFRSIIFLIMSLLSLWLAGFLWFGVTASADPVPLSQTTDAIVVLTGGAGRVEEGLELFAEGRAPRLFISGVNRQVKLEEIKALYKGGDLPPCCIELGYAAENTQGNAQETLDWLKSHNVHSIRLVTSDYHMPRARLEFAMLYENFEIYPHPVKSGVMDAEKKTSSLLLVNEYHKSIAAFFRNLFRAGPV